MSLATEKQRKKQDQRHNERTSPISIRLLIHIHWPHVPNPLLHFRSALVLFHPANPVTNELNSLSSPFKLHNISSASVYSSEKNADIVSVSMAYKEESRQKIRTRTISPTYGRRRHPSAPALAFLNVQY